MRSLVITTCLSLSLLAIAGHGWCEEGIDGVLPLPAWPDDGPENRPPLGGFLLPGGLLPPTFGSDNPAFPPGGSSGLNNASVTDLSLFLPESLLSRLQQNTSTQAAPTPDAALIDVGSEFLAEATAAPQDAHLIDPDHLITETQAEDIGRLLESHAEDARIKAYVMVLDRNQKLPRGINLSSTASGALTRSDSCLAVFPLGEPWRARLFLSKTVHDAATASYLASLTEDCANDAMLVSDPIEQLHRFSVRLSIRLFWIEKMMADEKPGTQPTAASRMLHPVDESIFDTKTPGLLTVRQHSLLTATLHAWPIFLIIALIIAGTILGLRLRRIHLARLKTHIWILPDPPFTERLGGAFGGGGGASIQFR